MLNNEDALLKRFKLWVEDSAQRPTWRFQTEIPVGEMVADGRIVEINTETGIVKDVVAYVEAKADGSDLRDILTGLGQSSYYAEQTGSSAWLVMPHNEITRLLSSQKRIDPRVSLFDLDELRLIRTEQVSERMGKSRLKRKQERPLFSSCQRAFKITIKTPLAITTPKVNGDGEVIFNAGQRVRGLLKECAQTVSRTLADACKYSIYVEPIECAIGTKSDLQLVQKFVPDSSGRSMKREFYELNPPITLEFVVRSIHPQLTAEVIENLLRQAGMFCGIGDSHSDGYHGRFDVAT